ncbi:TIGR04206 family protein [Haloparvum sp. PAK95]|uniref:TIGR04206 family protein n=1 Tax=Haloparvum sp. PAK95 TaxID=3418962 RepID=UPI003D2EBBA2
MSTDSLPHRADDDPPRESAATSSLGAVLAIAALVFVPVTAIEAGPDRFTLVMQWGFLHLVTPFADASTHAYPLWTFFAEQPRSFGSLPKSIQAWPLALGLHAVALASALLGATVGREDRRVTGGVLVLAGIATFWVTLGVAHRFGVGLDAGLFSVLPIGAAGTWAVVGVMYRADVRAIFTPGER